MSSPWPRVISNPLHAFLVTWLGQLVSWLGSGLTSFAVGILVYRESGSLTRYSLASLFYFVPMLVLSPFAGALIDRWDRRQAMLLSDLGAGLSAVLIWLMLVASEAGLWALELWHFYLPIALAAGFGTLRWPAYLATMSLLVPKQHLGRANGLTELAMGAGQILAPLLAGLLVERIGMHGIVLIDLATFAFSITTLLLVRFPRPPPVAAAQVGKRSPGRDIAEGWRFIRTRPGLFQLVVFVAISNLVMGLIAVLFTPLVLSFSDASTLGLVRSASGVGMMAGGLLMSAWGGPQRRVRGALGFYVLSGSALLAAALPPSVWAVAAAAFLFLFCSPLIFSPLQSIWQSKVPPGLQGRVFSVRRMIALSAPPLAGLLAGPLADHVFEPWLAPGGALASTVGRVVGTGPGRGVACLFMVLGVLVLVHAGGSALSPRLRDVEDELPDALRGPDTGSAAPAPVPAEQASAGRGGPALGTAAGER